MFAEKISEIFADKNLSNSFGEFNKQESENYTITKVDEQLREIYKDNGLS